MKFSLPVYITVVSSFLSLTLTPVKRVYAETAVPVTSEQLGSFDRGLQSASATDASREGAKTGGSASRDTEAPRAPSESTAGRESRPVAHRPETPRPETPRPESPATETRNPETAHTTTTDTKSPEPARTSDSPQMTCK